MNALNNLDIFILIIIVISALIALNRGFIREVMSILGWILVCFAVIFVGPVCKPFVMKYVASEKLATCLTAGCIVITFLFAWSFFSNKVESQIKTSKLGNIDKLLGFVFGIIRAFLIVVLFNILVSWIIPAESLSGAFKDSKYFNVAGEFAKPIEKLIPKNVLKELALKDDKSQNNEEKDNEVSEKGEPLSDSLFEQLAQPIVKKKGISTEDIEDIKNADEFEGYKDSERDNLDRLIESSAD